jgi:uncharacterized membrane protein
MADEVRRVGASRDRVDFLTDGVFAIVATLLVLEIDVPEIPDHHTQAELWRSLGDVAPSFAAFAFSFLTILVYWVNHESLSRVVTHYPYRLVWINLMVLFFISMIPFTTKFISEYPTEPAAVLIYGLVLLLTSLAAVLGYWYVAFSANLMRPEISHETRVQLLKRWIAGPVLYLVAVLAALVSVYVSIAIYIAIPLMFFVPAVQEGVLEALGEE